MPLRSLAVDRDAIGVRKPAHDDYFIKELKGNVVSQVQEGGAAGRRGKDQVHGERAVTG